MLGRLLGTRDGVLIICCKRVLARLAQIYTDSTAGHSSKKARISMHRRLTIRRKISQSTTSSTMDLEDRLTQLILPLTVLPINTGTRRSTSLGSKQTLATSPGPMLEHGQRSQASHPGSGNVATQPSPTTDPTQTARILSFLPKQWCITSSLSKKAASGSPRALGSPMRVEHTVCTSLEK